MTTAARGRFVTRLSARVRLVLAPNPSPMTLTGTNTYLVGDGAPIVIDPGPLDDEHLTRVAEEAGSVSLILLTHWHVDHSEGAARLAEMTGAPLAAPPALLAEDAMAVVDGEVYGEGDGALTAIATPGHAADHFSFLLESEGVLFTGDHILGEGTTVVAYPDGDMEAYLRSLERVRDLEGVRRLYPGHGPVVDDVDRVVDYYIQHRLEREEQVLAAVAAGDATIEAMVERIYAEVPRHLHPAAALSVRAHLDKLRREGLLEESDGVWRRA